MGVTIAILATAGIEGGITYKSKKIIKGEKENVN